MAPYLDPRRVYDTVHTRLAPQTDYASFVLLTEDHHYITNHEVLLRVPAGALLPQMTQLPQYLPLQALRPHAEFLEGAQAGMVRLNQKLYRVDRHRCPSPEEVEQLVEGCLEDSLEAHTLLPIKDEGVRGHSTKVYESPSQGWWVYLAAPYVEALEALGLQVLAHGRKRCSPVLWVDESNQVLALLLPLNHSEIQINENGRSSLLPAILLEDLNPQEFLQGGLLHLLPRPGLQFRPGLDLDTVLGLDLDAVCDVLLGDRAAPRNRVHARWPDGSPRVIDTHGPPRAAGVLRMHGVPDARILSLFQRAAVARAATTLLRGVEALELSLGFHPRHLTQVLRLEQLRELFDLALTSRLQRLTLRTLHRYRTYLVPRRTHEDRTQAALENGAAHHRRKARV